jgi:hypothetical protein
MNGYFISFDLPMGSEFRGGDCTRRTRKTSVGRTARAEPSDPILEFVKPGQMARLAAAGAFCDYADRMGVIARLDRAIQYSRSCLSG